MKSSQPPAFRCPLRASDGYVSVHVRRPSGAWYRTSFYRCFGCSVMFESPEDFTRQKQITHDPGAMGGGHQRSLKDAE